MTHSRLVYSTDPTQFCPECQQALSSCRCQQAEPLLGNGKVRIHRDRQGRAGKSVLLIKELPLTETALKQLTTELKKKLGCGGTYKEGLIEIQSDKPEQLLTLLLQKGFSAKLAGS